MSNPVESAQSVQGHLSLKEKLAYGAGDLGPAITANILVFFLLYFLVNVAGLNPALAGSILLLGNIWDAVNDPMVGVVSDRTQHRWGRRLPWIVYGAIPFGITYFLQWIVPASNQWVLFGYYLAIALVSNTFFTVVNLPYTALTPELTQDYDERTSLNSFRFAFSIGGSILSLVLAQVIFALYQSDPKLQYIVLGLVTAVLSTLPLFWCAWGIWHRAIAAEVTREQIEAEAAMPLLQQIRIAFSNRAFLFVMGIYLCSWLAFQNTAAILPFYIVNWMQLPETSVTQAAIAVQITALLMLAVWNQVSQRIGKKGAYFLGISLWLVGQIGLMMLRPEQTNLVYPLAVVVGFGVSTAYLIPWSMLPDVIELDELQTGQRREGIFYSFMTLGQKISRGVGLFAVGVVLRQAGFVERVAGQPMPEQPAAATEAIRLATGVFPAVLLVISLILAYFYPITREIHAEVLLKLKARREQQKLS